MGVPQRYNCPVRTDQRADSRKGSANTGKLNFLRVGAAQDLHCVGA